MIDKIIFFITSPFNQRDYKRFGIETLQANGFDVEVWDFTPFLHPDVWRSVKVPDFIKWEKYIPFLKLNSLKSAISDLKSNCFIVCFIPYRFQYFQVYRALSKVQIPYAVFMANALPQIKTDRWPFNIIQSLKTLTLTTATLYTTINKIFLRIPYRGLGIKAATVILAGGTKSTIYNYPTDNKTEILWLHTFDYDIYLNESKTAVEGVSKQGVFLDEYLPFHSDYIHSKLPIPVTPEEYYTKLCDFFNLLENKYGVHIVIAVHPKSGYEEHPDYFGGRLLIKGKTAELIKESEFIMLHTSTALNFAVLFNKPAIFITTNQIKQSGMNPYVEAVASVFGKTPINIENLQSFNLREEVTINKKAYAQYKQSYIKKEGSKELPFWQIFSDYIKETYK